MSCEYDARSVGTTRKVGMQGETTGGWQPSEKKQAKERVSFEESFKKIIPPSFFLNPPVQEKEQEECCPTCLEEYTKENPKIETKCGHAFHLSCIYEWLERKPTCPVCGKGMNFHEIT